MQYILIMFIPIFFLQILLHIPSQSKSSFLLLNNPLSQITAGYIDTSVESSIGAQSACQGW